MNTRNRPLSLMSLAAIAMAITACGSAPQVGATTGADTTGKSKLVTLRVGPSVTSAALTAAVTGAKVLVFDRTTSRAVLSVPVSTASTLSTSAMGAQSLGSLDAGVIGLEDDTVMRVLSEDPEAEALGVTTWAGGLTTWAGGVTTWAGGAVTWAGGASFLNSSDLADAAAYWNKLGIPLAQKLAPELGAGVEVAVIDTGIDLTHPLLQGRINTVSTWDFVDNDAVAQEVNSGGKYGHGTAVAGVILQIAPNARIQAYRALKGDGSGAMSTVIAALNKAVTNNARIVNMSLGSTTNSLALNTAISAALGRGILVVNSSGNAGTEGVVYPGAGLGTTFGVNSGLISVGSVDLNLKKSSFSQYAKNLTMTAPGEKILTTFPDGRLVKASGTSFAAPAVTGALALAMSTGATSASVVTTVKTSAMANLDTTFNPVLGAGTLNVGALVDSYR